jgi:hypothetical protein
MKQARTPRSSRLPVMLGLPVRFRFLTVSQDFTLRESPRPREITRAPLMCAQRHFGTDAPARHANDWAALKV